MTIFYTLGRHDPVAPTWIRYLVNSKSLVPKVLLRIINLFRIRGFQQTQRSIDQTESGFIIRFRLLRIIIYHTFVQVVDGGVHVK